MARTSIVQLTHQHADAWVGLYNEFHRPFSWIMPVNAKDSSALLEEGPASCSYVVLRRQKIVATATLDMRGESTTATIRNIAFRHGQQGAVSSLLNHMATVAEEKGFGCIEAWPYDSFIAVIGLLSETGFKEKGRDSLMLMELDGVVMNPNSSPLVIRSLADGISVGFFVESNRAAFEADGSRLLETAELERWITDFDGFIPDIQLAAESGNAIVGTVMSEIAKVRRGKSLVNLAWVYGLGVIPTARRRGIGTALMNELLKRLRSRGVSEVWLVTDSEGGVRTFYEQVGFRHHAYAVQYSRPLR